jgi:hypothetical protein
MMIVMSREKNKKRFYFIFKSKFRSSTHRATGLKLSNHPRITRYFSYRPETKGALPLFPFKGIISKCKILKNIKKKRASIEHLNQRHGTLEGLCHF